MKSKIFALLMVLIFFTDVMPAYALELDNQRSELQSVQQEIQTNNSKKNKANEFASVATDKYLKAKKELDKAQGNLAVFENERNVIQRKISVTNSEIAQKQAQLKKRVNIYKKRLRDIYINGQVNYLDILLGANSLNDFSSRLYFLGKIVANDIKLMDDLKEAQTEIEKKQAKLKVQKSEIEVIVVKYQREKDIVANKTLTKKRRYQAALAEQRKLNRENEELMARTAEISRNIKILEAGGTLPKSTGKFMWPIRGRITSPFGWRVHPIFGTRRFHSGIDIAADYGDNIKACDGGVVIYSAWMGGYGYAVMINNGNGLVSLYGHNTELLVSKGQRVVKGQIIAHAGSTGNSTGPHCHFEVRLNGEAVNPRNYLP